MFYLTVVNKILRHCHPWLARQYNIFDRHFISKNTDINIPKYTRRIGMIGNETGHLLECVELYVNLKLRSHCADVATVHPGAGQPEALLLAHTTLLESSCRGTYRSFSVSLHRNEWDFTSKKDEQFDKTKY